MGKRKRVGNPSFYGVGNASFSCYIISDESFILLLYEIALTRKNAIVEKTRKNAKKKTRKNAIQKQGRTL